ncbi:MAG: SirA family protein [Hyphomicrobium sp.]|nr:MAG: SirA family protein [Hyphomicrobium sp.]PPD00114.1 MAG: SirA family protein [Hyphomicrobium sp.]
MADRTLDTSGLSCPIPILKAKKALGEMAVGSVLEVIATDPAAPNDFIAFCKATGHALLDNGTREGCYWFHIQRAQTS